MAINTVYGYQNLRTQSRSIFLKSRVQEPNAVSVQDSRSLCLLFGRIGEDDHEQRNKVTSPPDRSLTELPRPCHRVDKK